MSSSVTRPNIPQRTSGDGPSTQSKGANLALQLQPPAGPKKSYIHPRYMHPTASSSARRQAMRPSEPSGSSPPPPQSLSSRALAGVSDTRCSDIAESDPAHIAQLWVMVRACSADVQCEGGKRKTEASLSGSQESTSLGLELTDSTPIVQTQRIAAKVAALGLERKDWSQMGSS